MTMWRVNIISDQDLIPEGSFPPYYLGSYTPFFPLEMANRETSKFLHFVI